MKALLNYFVDLCLLRAGPQDLPSSKVLLILTTLANTAVGVVMIMDARGGGGNALAESGFEVALMLASLYLGLKLRRLLPRFYQVATALMGSGLLLGLLALPLVRWSQRAESSEAGLLLLVLFIWSMVVMGHILRHSFDIRFNLGLGVAVLYTLMAWNLTYLFFPAVA
ncbi:MAG: hypothetical protein ABFR65_08400 [Pseudomonadota bacterium]